MWQGNSLSYIAYCAAKHLHGREVGLKTEGGLASSATVLEACLSLFKEVPPWNFPMQVVHHTPLTSSSKEQSVLLAYSNRVNRILFVKTKTNKLSSFLRQVIDMGKSLRPF